MATEKTETGVRAVPEHNHENEPKDYGSLMEENLCLLRQLNELTQELTKREKVGSSEISSLKLENKELAKKLAEWESHNKLPIKERHFRNIIRFNLLLGLVTTFLPIWLYFHYPRLLDPAVTAIGLVGLLWIIATSMASTIES